MRYGKTEVEQYLTVDGVNVKTKLTDLETVSDKNEANTLINAFRIAVNGALSVQKMVDGIVDEYEDESGIDTVNSLNESYDSTDDYYSPTALYTLTTSPYFHAKCNDSDSNTTVTDNGTGSNNGVASTNTVNLSVTGKINNAFEFNGSTEYVTLNSLQTDIESDTSGSISLWFNPSSTAIGWLFVMSDMSQQANHISIYKSGNNLNIYAQQASEVKWVQTYTTTITTGTWYHVALVQNGTSPKLYFNGVDVTNLSTTTDTTFWFADNSANFDYISLGSIYNQNLASWEHFFNGKMDDVRYYQNKALTSDEVKAIYNAGTGTEDDQPESGADNLTLISDTFTAEAQPDFGRIVLLEEDVDSITINTDLKAYATRDGGTSWVEGTLVDEGDYDASKKILVADFDFTASGVGTGTNMEYKLVTANNKDLKLHASALTWD